MKLNLFLVLQIVSFGLLASCQSPQDEWTFPSLPDYSSSVNDGETYTFRWTADFQTYFAEYCPDCDPENVVVWLTGGTDSTFTKHLVSSSTDVTNSRSIVWQVNASGPDEIEYWVLRFTTPGGYVDGQMEVSSPMFKIDRSLSEPTSTSEKSFPSVTSFATVGTPIFVSVTSSSASETSPLNTGTSIPSEASPSNTAITTSSDHESAPSRPSNISTDGVVDDVRSTLTPTNIALIVVGAVAVVSLIALVILGFCCYKRRRARRPQNVDQQYHQSELSPYVQRSQPVHSAVGHSPRTRLRLSRPNPATHIFTTTTDHSNTSLVPALPHTIQDQHSFREPTTRHATTDLAMGDARVARSGDNNSRGDVTPMTDHSATGYRISMGSIENTRSESDETPAGGMTEIENPNSRFSTNLRDYLEERQRKRMPAE